MPQEDSLYQYTMIQRVSSPETFNNYKYTCTPRQSSYVIIYEDTDRSEDINSNHSRFQFPTRGKSIEQTNMRWLRKQRTQLHCRTPNWRTTGHTSFWKCAWTTSQNWMSGHQTILNGLRMKMKVEPWKVTQLIRLLEWCSKAEWWWLYKEQPHGKGCSWHLFPSSLCELSSLHSAIHLASQVPDRQGPPPWSWIANSWNWVKK